jgi:PAS domain S-box-containing protein
MDDAHAAVVQSRRLAEAKARQEAVLASIGDGVVVVSDKGEVIFINAQALSMLKVSADLIIGKHLIRAIEMFGADKKPIGTDSHPMQQALLRGQKISTTELYFRRADSKNFPVAVTASPVFLQQVLIGGVLVFRDVTHEKEVDRMKTEFISLASHQLRTPLSAMKWFAEMLISGDAGELTEEQKEMVNNIYLSNERMIELVNSLLNISRIESGRIIIDPRPTNLKKLIDEVIGELQPKIATKKHAVVVSVHSQLPEVNIDSKLIRHVYMNLLTNAIKYTAEGGEVHVMVSRSGSELVSQVSDNGYGIPLNQQEKIFQKFFRADNVAKFETDGTGLGLYLVKAIVEASGGHIWFKSEEGKGSSFWFSLPLSGSRSRPGEVSINS